MQQSPKERKKPNECEPVENNEAAKRSYYYDDAHGYQDFDPDQEKDEDEDEPTND